MTDADGLVRWTVRLAVACYAARVLADAGGFGSLRLRRLIWTVGFLFYAAHVAAAFQFVHGWSHDEAHRETTRQTAAVVGWRSGAGLWVNYAFTLLWLADVVAWWAVGADYPRRFRRISHLVLAVFAFLMFNATAVFGPPFWRPFLAGYLLSLAAAMTRRPCSPHPSMPPAKSSQAK